jgi:serine/threonine-protein phosphatase 2A regulatory subunit B''
MSTTTNNNTIVYDDWEPLMQDIVDTHPGLKFLHDHKEFHTRYIKTVIARIYYTVNRSWSGKITLTELKRSNFLSVLESLELEDDINLIKDYFSYEHFYVIYCKFWELDKDHDLLISKEDLYRHNNYGNLTTLNNTIKLLFN